MTSYKKNKIVTCNFERIGMGNVMFKLASTFGIAKKRGAICYMGEKTTHLDGFCGPFPLVKPANIDLEHYIKEKYEGIYMPEMISENPQHMNIRVGRYLQSHKYFSHCEDDIKNMFKSSQNWNIKASNWLEAKQISDSDIKVCIHIRRGDMMAEPQTMPSLSWFSAVISKLPTRAKIIIFSDDMEWVQSQPLFMKSNYIHAKNNAKMLDFTLMTLCHYYILSRGTFGWWAAYLSSSKIKVFYKNEFAGTSLDKHFDSYYPKDWEEIKGSNAPPELVYDDIINKPIINIGDNFDLMNWYRFSNLTDLSLTKIMELCINANKNMWKFHILNIKGSFTPTTIMDWRLSVDQTKKLNIVLLLGDNSTIELYQKKIKKINVKKNSLIVFPSYIMFKCTNAAIFYANGNTFI